MDSTKKEHPIIKIELHERNKHKERYDFPKLIASFPKLKKYVKVNEYGDESIDFFNPQAVKALNKSLLIHHYKLKDWDIPDNYLCPPIPGRADYLHYIADVLKEKNNGKIPQGKDIKCLDIGVGANCIYPIIGASEYGWNFVGSDIAPISVKNAKNIVKQNPQFKDKIDIRLQPNKLNVFKGIIAKNERFDVTICNPPFHTSAKEAYLGSMRKQTNLKGEQEPKVNLNFGGIHNELWCKGGEEEFIRNMIRESLQYHESSFWFSSLVSKKANLTGIYKALKKAGAIEVKTIEMGQGNKISRIVVWTFLNPKLQKLWAEERWRNA